MSMSTGVMLHAQQEAQYNLMHAKGVAAFSSGMQEYWWQLVTA